MKIFAIANQKGGVGKTTTAINFAAALVKLGYKVLAIDLDPQGNMTDAFGYEADDLEVTLYDIFEKKSIEDVYLDAKGLKLIPSNLSLSNADIMFSAKIGKDRILKKAINNLKEEYDYIVMDCPPSIGVLTINALAAATDVIIPMQAEYFATKGLSLLVGSISEVREDLNPDLNIAGIVTTMYNSSRNLSKHIVASVDNHELLSDFLCKTKIRQNVKLAESPAHSMSIFEYDADSNGAEDYMNLTKEILERVNG